MNSLIHRRSEYVRYGFVTLVFTSLLWTTNVDETYVSHMQATNTHQPVPDTALAYRASLALGWDPATAWLIGHELLTPIPSAGKFACQQCAGEGTVLVSRDRRRGEKTCRECEGLGEL